MSEAELSIEVQDNIRHAIAAMGRIERDLAKLLPPPPEPAAEDDDRRYLTIDPRRGFGAVCIQHTRLRAETIGELVYAGDSVESVADDYDIGRVDVLMACWYCAMHEPDFKRWRRWGEVAFHALAGRGPLDELPDPPSGHR